VSEAHLSDVLGCGRTPLRKALQRSRHHYLIEIPPRRGILIPQLSIVDYQQLSEAQVMGSAMMDLAAERINDRQLEQLRDVIGRQEECNKQADYYNLAELNGRFHTLIAEATGNAAAAAATPRMLVYPIERFHFFIRQRSLFTGPLYMCAGLTPPVILPAPSTESINTGHRLHALNQAGLKMALRCLKMRVGGHRAILMSCLQLRRPAL